MRPPDRRPLQSHSPSATRGATQHPAPLTPLGTSRLLGGPISGLGRKGRGQRGVSQTHLHAGVDHGHEYHQGQQHEAGQVETQHEHGAGRRDEVGNCGWTRLKGGGDGGEGWGSESPWEGGRSCSISPTPAAQAFPALDSLRRAHTAFRTDPGASSVTVWLLPFPPSCGSGPGATKGEPMKPGAA